MSEVPDESIHLMVTSPPYYNAPFDYPGLFKSYEEYLELIRSLAKELRRALASSHKTLESMVHFIRSAPISSG